MNRSASLTLKCLLFSSSLSRVPFSHRKRPSYMDPKLSPEERAADLVHRMTRECPASAENGESVPRLR